MRKWKWEKEWAMEGVGGGIWEVGNVTRVTSVVYRSQFPYTAITYVTIMQSRGYIFTLIFVIIVSFFFSCCINSKSDIDQFCLSSYLVAPPIDYPLGEKTTLLQLEFRHLTHSSWRPSNYVNVTNNSTNINNLFTFHSVVQINAQTCDFHCTRLFFKCIIIQKQSKYKCWFSGLCSYGACMYVAFRLAKHLLLSYSTEMIIPF